MGQTDKLFGGFLRMLIARMKAVAAAYNKGNHAEAMELIQEIMTDLQNTLED